MGCIRRPIMVPDQPWVEFARSSFEEERAAVAAVGGNAPAAPRSVLCPPPVLRGANEQAASIDWFRCTASRDQIDKACALLDKHFGAISQAAKGRFFLSCGRSWGSAGVFYDADGENAAGHCCVEVAGSMLDLLGSAYRLDLVRDFLQAGFKVTRIDIALDFTGEKISLVRDVASACEAGHLCRLLRHSYTAECERGEVVQEIIRLGSRGSNGSGRYVRIYDKGLETGTRERGEWVRAEAELTDDVGHQSAMALVDSITPGPFMASLVLGAFELREGSGDVRANRRPLVAWWSALLSSCGSTRFVAMRVRSTLRGYCEWLSVAVVPQMKGLADACGLGLSDFQFRTIGDVPSKGSVIKTEIGMGVLSLIRGDRYWAERLVGS